MLPAEHHWEPAKPALDPDVLHHRLMIVGELPFAPESYFPAIACAMNWKAYRIGCEPAAKDWAESFWNDSRQATHSVILIARTKNLNFGDPHCPFLPHHQIKHCVSGFLRADALSGIGPAELNRGIHGAERNVQHLDMFYCGFPAQRLSERP